MKPRSPQQKIAVLAAERVRNSPGMGNGGSLNGLGPSSLVPKPPVPPELQTIPANPFPGVSGMGALGPKTPTNNLLTPPNHKLSLPGTTPINAGANLNKVPNQNKVKFPKLYKSVKF